MTYYFFKLIYSLLIGSINNNEKKTFLTAKDIFGYFAYMLKYYSKLERLKWMLFLNFFFKLSFKCKWFLQASDLAELKLSLLDLHLTFLSFTANKRNLYNLWYRHSKKILLQLMTTKSYICPYLWALVVHFLSKKSLWISILYRNSALFAVYDKENKAW